MARHAKRDEEAGGPGLGVLETRKRTRRGPDGTIITKPTKKQARAAMLMRPTALAASSIQVTEAVHSSSTSSSASIRSFNDKAATPGSHNQDSSSNLTSPPSIAELNYHGQDHGTVSVAPISPPTSVHPSCSSVNLDSGALDNCQPVHHSDPLIAPMVPGGPYEPYAEPIPGQFDAADGSWRSQDLGPGMDYEDFFDLDTGMYLSFVFRTKWMALSAIRCPCPNSMLSDISPSKRGKRGKSGGE